MLVFRENEELKCFCVEFSEDLYRDGYHDIVNVDYSESVIEKMASLTKEKCPKMKWECKDMRDLNGFSDETFDVVLDKGALDALWADAGSQWDPNDETKANVVASLNETFRVLKRGGLYLMISFGQPHFRKPLLAIVGWPIEVVEFEMYFIYVMRK